jgi:tetratricopeptide (TPR) repeat protein
MALGVFLMGVVLGGIGLLQPCRGQDASRAASAAGEQYHLRALELVSAGDSSGAGTWFRKAWEANPEEPRYVQDLTIYYIHQKNFPKALETIRDYVKRLGPTALAWTLQGELLFEKRQYDPAYQSLRSALEISNLNYRAHELLGLILSVYRRYGPALEEMRVAAEQNPRSAQVHFYCGRLHYRAANYAAARDELAECLKLEPAYPQALENLGLAYEALGDASQAVSRYREAVELDRAGKLPPSEMAYVCLAACIAKEGKDEEAFSLLREGLARNANSAWANFELGRLYFKTGENALAERYLKRAAELDGNYSRPHFFLGKIYQHGNRPEEAKAELSRFQALDQDPDNREPQLTR